MYTFVLPLVVLANGLAAGVLVGTLLGGVPLLYSLPAGGYVRAHAFFASRFDPFMPVCLVFTVLGDAVLTGFGTGGPGRALFALAAVCALGTVIISLVKNVPINRWIRQLDADNLPPDFAERDPRYLWGMWNKVRSLLAVTAFLANVLALPVLLR